MADLSKFTFNKMILKGVVVIGYNQVCSQTLLKKMSVAKLCPLKYVGAVLIFLLLEFIAIAYYTFRHMEKKGVSLWKLYSLKSERNYTFKPIWHFRQLV